MALRNDLNAEVKNDLVTYNGATDGQAYILLGETVRGDTPVRFYYYNSTSSATVDGENILNATGMGAGRFIKMAVQEINLISPTFNNSPSVTIQTVANAANGSQISTTKTTIVSYSITISTTVSLAGNETGYVVLEICPTNSSTAGDWIEIGRATSGQSGALVIGLTLNQFGGGNITGMIPAGYYRRLRSVDTNGTPTYTYNSGQETQF